MPANQAMLAAQAALEQAGLRVEPLHIPHLLPEAIAHRARIGRQGLGCAWWKATPLPETYGLHPPP